MSEFYKSLGEKLKPNVYYAVLRADGDNVGAFISDISKSDKAVNDNKLFSKALSAFSKEAKNIVKKCHGFPVYTGGDDVLAFVPLDTCVSCAVNLSKHFKTTLKEHLSIDPEKFPTLSVGIAIVHHLESLDDALALSLKAESDAKSVKDKDALSIILSKRSGLDVGIKGKFFTEKKGFLKNLFEYIRLFSNDKIPFGLPYELKRLNTDLSGINADLEEKKILLEIQKLEIKNRILPQKNISEDSECSCIFESVSEVCSPEDFENFINTLIIARFFASEIRLHDEGA